MWVGGQSHVLAALPPERPGTRCVGGWVELRTGPDRCEKSRPHWNPITRLSVP
jgi:hypothetical protein